MTLSFFNVNSTKFTYFFKENELFGSVAPVEKCFFLHNTYKMLGQLLKTNMLSF